MSNIKIISLMKQYQRLFDGPIDSSGFHNSFTEFEKYVNGQTNMLPYSGQICAVLTESIPTQVIEFFFIYKDGDGSFKYKKFNDPINYKQILSPVFCISDLTTTGTGIFSNYISMPYSGTINNLKAIVNKKGKGNIIIDIERISESDYLNNVDNWVSIFSEDKSLVINEDSLINNTDYILADNVILKGDFLRVNLKNIGSEYESLTITLNIECIIK